MRFLRVTTAMITLMALSGINPFEAELYARTSGDSHMRIVSIEPTVLFKEDGKGLLQGVDAVIENVGQAVEARLNISHHSGVETIDLGIMKAGKGDYLFFLPEISETTDVQFELISGTETQDRFEMSWTSRKHWEVCMIPMSHHDLGYTNPIELVLQKYHETYQDVIRFCEETEDYPEEAKFRYTVEGSLSLQDFIEKSDVETLEKLAKYMQEGRIEIHALYGNLVTGMLGHEEAIRQMYPSFRISRELGGQVKTGSITDMPGLSWGLPTLLSGAGIRYFFAGMPSYFDWYIGGLGGSDKYGDLVDHTFWDEKNILRSHGRPDAFYWKGPDNSEILVYYQGGYGCWSPESVDQVMAELPVMLNEMDEKENPFSLMRYAGFGCLDNTKTDIIVSDLAREWNSKWAYPRLIVSTSTMFFEKLEKQCSDLKTITGDMPDTDYPVGALSMARETALNRNTHDKLHSTEKLAAMAHLLLETNDYPSDEIKRSYHNMMLYDEHCWGMWAQAFDDNMKPWAHDEKSSFAYKAAGLTDLISGGQVDMYDGSSFRTNAKDIAGSIDFREDGKHIVVFNTLSFDRSDLVTIPNFLHEGPFQLIDAETGQKVAHQVIELDSPQAPVPHAAKRYATGQFEKHYGYSLAFVAENVPSMGYKTFRIELTDEIADETAGTSSSLILADHGIENCFFKIALDPGTGMVLSIYDKKLGMELVDQDAPHRVNQMITRWVKTGKEESPQTASIRKGQYGPVYASIMVSTSVAGCPQLTQEIRLYDKIKRVDFANRVLKDQTPIMEVYFAFPFRMDNPDFRFEAPLSVIKPLRDQLPGSNTHYYSVQHWADVSDGEAGITFTPVDAHLLEFGGLHPTVVSQAHHGVNPPDFLPDFVTEMNRGHMYSFVINSNFRTNMPSAQLGDILFRYSVTSHDGDWIEGRPRDFGWAVCNPLVPVLANAGTGNGNLPESLSFCRIDKSNVMLMTLKKAEDDEGVILRLNETEGCDTEIRLTLPHTIIQKVYETNLVEKNERLLDFEGQTIKIFMKPFGIKTIRVIH